MDEQQYKAAKSRTDSKLQYAAVHLDELRGIDRRGSEFERAHQESFLFHLFGVRDAFLQELNVFHECDLSLKEVDEGKLRHALGDMGKQSKAFMKLIAVESDPESWLSYAKEMRHHSTHRHSVPRVHHVGGEKHGEVFLTNTRNGKVFEQDYLSLFEEWHGQMTDLIKELRCTN